MTQSSLVDSIHQFWFGTNSYGTLPLAKVRLWFAGQEANPERDDALDYIERQFLFQINAACSGGLADWQKDARGSLALILLLDQFPRLLAQDQTSARECQRYALRYCKAGLHAGFDRLLTPVERCFFYGPLLYSRNMPDRQHGIRLLERLLGQTCEADHLQHEQHNFVLHSLYVAVKQNAMFENSVFPCTIPARQQLRATA